MPAKCGNNHSMVQFAYGHNKTYAHYSSNRFTFSNQQPSSTDIRS